MPLYCTMVNACKQLGGYPIRSYRPLRRRWNRHFGARAWTYWNRVGLMWCLARGREWLGRRSRARTCMRRCGARSVCPHMNVKRLSSRYWTRSRIAWLGGEAVKLSGLGVFTVRQKRERLGRNLKTGEPALISARRVVSFGPSVGLKDKLNSSQRASPPVTTNRRGNLV